MVSETISDENAAVPIASSQVGVVNRHVGASTIANMCQCYHFQKIAFLPVYTETETQMFKMHFQKLSHLNERPKHIKTLLFLASLIVVFGSFWITFNSSLSPALKALILLLRKPLMSSVAHGFLFG